jgi:hypothetical protein
VSRGEVGGGGVEWSPREFRKVEQGKDSLLKKQGRAGVKKQGREGVKKQG